jgi:hypothetical protein
MISQPVLHREIISKNKQKDILHWDPPNRHAFIYRENKTFMNRARGVNQW